MTLPTDRYIDVNTINTRYWAEGNRGQPVILIHGIGGYVENWLPCLSALSERYRTYALDIVGMGRSDKPPNASYSISSMAQFVKDFMDTLRIERAHVAGHSMGSAIALQLALRFPKMVDKLALINSAGLGRGMGLTLYLAKLPLLGKLFTRPSRVASRLLLKMMVYDRKVITDKISDEYYQMAFLPGNQHCFLKILRENANIFGQSEKVYGPNVRGLSTLTKPVLLVTGTNDRVMPPAHVRAAARLLPNARLHVFEKCGHVPMFEKTQAFNELLLDFLDN